MAANAKRLNDGDYSRLIQLSTIDEIWTYLRHYTVYGIVLQTIEGYKSRRIAAERGLRRFVPSEIKRFAYYTQGKEKYFLRTYQLKEELIKIKLVIRFLSRGINPQKELAQRYDHIQTFILPQNKLNEITDWQSFKRIVSQSELNRIFFNYEDTDREENIFSIEKSIERFYYDRLMKEIKKLPQGEHKYLIDVFKKEYDLLNLIWFYRGKRYYHLPREELIAYSFKGGAKLRTSNVEKLSNTRTLKEFLEEVKKYPDYEFLFCDDGDLETNIIKRHERYLYNHYERLFYRSQNGFDKLIAYIELLYLEAKDITFIIECKRYQLTEAETKKHLIRPVV